MADLITEKEVLKILKEERFLSASEVISAWRRNSERRKDIGEERNKGIRNIDWEAFNKKKGQIGCSLDVIREMAEKDGWYLIYVPSFSLLEVPEILDFGSDKKTMFFQYYEWLAKREPSAYHFITMEPVFSNICWKEQGDKISEMGLAFYRPSTTLGIIAQISYFLTRKVCAGETNSWGPEIHKIKSAANNDLELACVSIVWGIKFQIYNWPCESPEKRIGTLIARHL